MISFRNLTCHIFIASLALTAHNAVAQVPESPPNNTLSALSAPPLMKRDVDAEVSRMKELYRLSESQAGKMREILENQDKTAQAKSRDDSRSFRKRIAEM